MTRVQILLEKKEIEALRKRAKQSGKSYSLLVREAIDNTYTTRCSEDEIALMAREAKRGKGTKKFSSLKSARQYLWSL
ncbi:ribbon-helix-helix protein, CopG family [Elusimicrobiota bacterium]